jgi:hypothetical protein
MAEPQGLVDAGLEKEIGSATPHGKHEASEVVVPANTEVAMGGTNDTTHTQADGTPVVPSSSATKMKLKPGMLQSPGDEGSKPKSVAVKAAGGKSGSNPPTPLVKKVCNLWMFDPLVYMCL